MKNFVVFGTMSVNFWEQKFPGCETCWEQLGILNSLSFDTKRASLGVIILKEILDLQWQRH